MPNLIKKCWTVSIVHAKPYKFLPTEKEASKLGRLKSKPYLLVAGDTDLSRAVKGGLLCKEILDHSVPLLRLVEHILSAKVSIDLCLYMLTQHKLGKAVIQQLKKTNIRVRFIVNESSSKA